MTVRTDSIDAPRVSVIVPCRDRISMLRDALDGIAAQTLDPTEMELLIVDGESSDPVEDEVAGFAKDQPFRVRYFRVTPDNGPVGKRNHGAREAAGTILAFTDSDCRPAPDWLASGLAPFSDPNVALVSGPVTYKPEQKAVFFSKLSAETLGEHPTYPTANVFYRKSVFLSMGGFDETLAVRDFLNRATECADTDLAWRVRKTGARNAFTKDALVFHEIEHLTPFKWVMEPTRLILLPLLLRLHPEIAPHLLRANLIFYRGSLMIYLGLCVVVASLLLDARLLWFLPLAFLALALKRARSIRPRKLAIAAWESLFNVFRMAVLAFTLIVGSLRYGRLVL